MAKTIKFFAQKVSSEAGFYTDRNRRHLTEVEVTLPEDFLESQLISEFSIEELLGQYQKDEFLEHIGAEYLRQWLANNE